MLATGRLEEWPGPAHRQPTSASHPLLGYASVKRSPLRRVSARQKARTEHLRILKAQLLWARGERCERCGQKALVLDLHHLLSRARGGEDVPENLAILCRACHTKVTDLACDDWQDWVWSARGRRPSP